jgi:hypothetical protein
VVGLFSRLSRWFQNGQVQRYIFGLMIGAAAVFAIPNCRHHAGLSYRQVDGNIELTAEPGSGLSGNRAQLRWDLNGDGQPDTVAGSGKLLDSVVVTVPAGDVSSSVTLWIEDPISKKTITVKRDIRLSGAADQGGK